MTKDELINEIGTMLLEDEDVVSSQPWQHLVIVVQIVPGSMQINGFVYRGNGASVPTSPANFGVFK